MVEKSNSTGNVQRLFIENIKKQRSKLNLSQIEFAELLSLSASYIAELETGRKFPSITVLQKISDILKIKPFQLFISEADIAVIYSEAFGTEYKRVLLKSIPEVIEKTFNEVLTNTKNE